MIRATIGIFSQGGVTFDTDYQAVLDYATTQGYTLPSSGQQTLQNQLVVDLKDAGVWSKLDTFAVFATDGDSDFALIDWIRLSQYNAVNSPTFTTDIGFTGDGATNYINTNFNSSNLTNNMSLNYWLYSYNTTGYFQNGAAIMGANPSRIDVWVANTTQILIKATATLSSSVDLETTGLHSLNRTSDTDVNLIINNVENTRTQAYNSSFPRDITLFFTRGNRYGDMTLSMNAFGENLVSERTDFYNAINNYMTAI